MRSNLKDLIPVPVKKALSPLLNLMRDPYVIKSYSQEGEDVILQRIFADQKSGFYVDVGAHHPRRFSNTYVFYRRGWSGINIEPNPDVCRAFNKERTRDRNLQMGIAGYSSKLIYYYFDEPALNTFDKNIVDSRLATTPYRVIKTDEIPVERLDVVFKKELPSNQIIDFLSVDVEGMDLAVLQSNDWKLYRPRCVLAESLNTSLEDAMGGSIFLYMRSQGYELFAKTYNTLIFKDKYL